MKRVDHYVAGGVLRVTLLTVTLCTLMMVSVLLFSQLDLFLRGRTPFRILLHYALLRVPEAFTFTLPPSLLFSIAFTFSQLSANNELICLYNATFSQKRLVLPVMVLALFCTLLSFGVQERLGVPAAKEQAALENEIGSFDPKAQRKDVNLVDYDAGYLFHAGRWKAESGRGENVVVLLLDEDGKAEERLDARSVSYSDDGWLLRDCTIHRISPEGVATFHESNHSVRLEGLTPELAEQGSGDINQMTRSEAKAYLARLEKLDHSLWRQSRVDWARRSLNCLSVMVMALIACLIPYKFKRNVLLFTIILSLSIAVVSYVLEMVSLILARQGLVGPESAMLAPMAISVLLAVATRLVL